MQGDLAEPLSPTARQRQEQQGGGVLQLLLADKRALVIAVGCIFCVIGQIMFWCKDSGERAGTYCLLLLVMSVANLRAYLSKSAWLPCATFVVFLIVYDIQICYTDEEFSKDNDQLDTADLLAHVNVLRAAHIFMLIGSGLATLVSFPWRGMTQGLNVWISVAISILLFVGNVLILAQGKDKVGDTTLGNNAICGSYSLTGSATKGTGILARFGTNIRYPILLNRALFIAVWNTASHLGGYTEGAAVSVILCMIHLHDYQPFPYEAPSGTKWMRAVDDWDTIVAGCWLVFIGMWFAVFHWLFGVQRVHERRPSKENLCGGSGGACAIITALVLVLAGGICIWAATQPAGNDDYHMAKPQEAWDVTAVVLGTVFLALGKACDAPAWALAGLVLEASVMNRILGSSSMSWPGSYLNQCPNQYSNDATGLRRAAPAGGLYSDGPGVLRLGYLLLVVGMLLSLLAVPGVAKARVTAQKLMSDGVVGACVVVLAFAVWAWCALSQHWGRLACTALLQLLSHLTSWREGSQGAFVLSLLFLPGMTPCTSCNGGLGKFAEFCVGLSLLYLCAKYVQGAAPEPVQASAFSDYAEKTAAAVAGLGEQQETTTPTLGTAGSGVRKTDESDAYMGGETSNVNTVT